MFKNYFLQTHSIELEINFKNFFSKLFILVIIFISYKIDLGYIHFESKKIYNQHDFVSLYFQDFLDSPFTFLFNNIEDLFITLFTQEFGVFWFSPIIFFGLIFSILLIRKEIILSITLLLVFSFYFGIINIWQSTGNAYGFRYLYPLITTCILLFLKYYKINNVTRLVEYYLLFFSVVSLLSVLFFEGWEGTQLSLNVIENSFGKYEKFIQPSYLTGFLKGFLQINAYLKIFTTSFLGLIFFKILIVFFGIERLFYF